MTVYADSAPLIRDVILAMPAGRELDALVAERVLGCKVKRQGSNPPEWGCGCWPRHHSGSEASFGYLKHYSTDIAATWLLVEALSARACSLALEDWRSARGCPARWAALFTLPTGHDTGQATADTAPLAICRAALLVTLESVTA